MSEQARAAAEDILDEWDDMASELLAALREKDEALRVERERGERLVAVRLAAEKALVELTWLVVSARKGGSVDRAYHALKESLAALREPAVAVQKVTSVTTPPEYIEAGRRLMAKKVAESGVSDREPAQESGAGEGRWIPVAERLPEEGQEIITLDRWGRLGFSPYARPDWLGERKCESHITHWMLRSSLPAPPDSGDSP